VRSTNSANSETDCRGKAVEYYSQKRLHSGESDGRKRQDP
jgi:hypothetical protein